MQMGKCSGKASTLPPPHNCHERIASRPLAVGPVSRPLATNAERICVRADGKCSGKASISPPQNCHESFECLGPVSRPLATD